MVAYERHCVVLSTKAVKELPLGELATERGLVGGPFGSSLGKKDYVPEGVPVIRGQNLAGTRRFGSTEFVYVSPEKVRRDLSRNLAAPGDVVFTQRGTFGQVGLVPKEPYEQYVISQSQMRFRADRSKVLPGFVYYCFRSPDMVDTILRRAIVTGVPHINLAILGALPIPVPALPEQRRVVAVLSAFDDKVDCNHLVVDLSSDLLACLFERALEPALRHLRIGDPLPEGWDTRSLGESVEVLQTGYRPKGGVKGFLEGVPSLGAENVLGLARYDFERTKWVPPSLFESMRRGVVESRDVLLYKDGGRPGEFEPHVSLLGDGFPFEKFCINEHVYRLRVPPPLTQEFLYCWLSSAPLIEEMRRKGTGVAIPGLNSTALKSLTLVVPPQERLQAFQDAAEPLVSRALAAALESRHLESLRDALLPHLMSGRLTITDAEALT